MEMKQLYKPALGIFILVMICLALKGCNKTPINNKTDIAITDDKAAEQIAGYNYNQASNKVKIVEKLIPIYKDRWKTKYDTIYKQAPDTCHYYLSKLNAEKNASDSINDIVIKSYGNLINAGIIYQAKKDSVILKQDVALKSKDTVIDSLTRSKKKYFKGFRHGFISGVIVSGAVNVGSKFVN
jgi:hypothetical protein